MFCSILVQLSIACQSNYCQASLMLFSVILLWLEYGRILAQSGHPNVTAILMSRSNLAQFSFVFSRSCQPNFRHDLSRSILAC